MGTNFYWKNPGHIFGLGRWSEFSNENKRDLLHIGKRSAAGFYCFDCGVTLVHNDVITRFSPGSRNRLVHTGQAGQSDLCPQCGAYVIEETLESSAAGLELGFRDSPSIAKELWGVRTCSSFNWAQDPGWVLAKLLALKNNSETVVIDEYEREYTAREFLEDLVICPMWFTNSVGTEFT